MYECNRRHPFTFITLIKTGDGAKLHTNTISCETKRLHAPLPRCHCFSLSRKHPIRWKQSPAAISVRGGKRNDLFLVQKILAHFCPLLTITCSWFHNLAHSVFKTWLLMIPNLLSVGFVCASLKTLVLSLNPECLQCNLVCLVWSSAFSPSNKKKKSCCCYKNQTKTHHDRSAS